MVDIYTLWCLPAAIPLFLSPFPNIGCFTPPNLFTPLFKSSCYIYTPISMSSASIKRWGCADRKRWCTCFAFLTLQVHDPSDDTVRTSRFQFGRDF